MSISISIGNEKLLPRLEVLRMAVKGAEYTIGEWQGHKDDAEISGLIQAFDEFEAELNNYIKKADPLLSAFHRSRSDPNCS